MTAFQPTQPQGLHERPEPEAQPAPRALAAAPAAKAAASEDVRGRVARHFFATAALVSLLAAAIFGLVTPELPDTRRAALVAAFLALTLICGVAMQWRSRHAQRWVAAVAAAAILVIGLASALLGWGLVAPGIGLFALFVCMAGAVSSRALGLAVAVWAAAVVAVLALAHQQEWLDQTLPGLQGSALWLRTLIQWLVIAAGMVGGLMIGHAVDRQVADADEREARFRGLLAIAADAYWEIDEHYRLTTLAPGHGGAGGPAAAVRGHGELPWELPHVGIDAEALDLLQAQLGEREPFHDLAVRWRGGNGLLRHFMVSGEPRRAARGQFVGYWGVARDVSAQVAANEALAATELRYQELFARIPTPLVLHRGHNVLDANPSAVALFGYPDLQSMIGQDLLGAYEGGESRERARMRIAELEALPAGRALPVVEFRLIGQGGRRVVARATGVRVDADGRPAILSIYVDDTERKAAEDAVRRSEAMLAHLVATSPDLITLSELGSGRTTMVNHTFERLSGYASAEVVGRTAEELGLWHVAQDRQRFLEMIEHQGKVQDMPTHFATKSGRAVPVLVSGARFAMDRREYLVINARDVSQVERARLEREAILDNASVGIAVTRDQNFVLANPRFEQMFGWRKGSLLGQPGRVIWASDDDYFAVGLEIGPQLARGESAEFERRCRRMDGSTFLARVAARAIDPSHPAKGGTIWIVDDVTEARQVEQALARACDEAEAANRAKSAFLANTSHELRTPLNGLIGLARLASAPGMDEARRTQYLDQISESAQALSAIISDILDLSKIEAGKFELENSAFDLGELLRGLHRAYTTLAEPRELEFKLEPGLGVASRVMGDPLRLRQILSNFLGNAIKFTTRGQVRLAARRLSAQRVLFEVHDTGPGIDDATQSRLFQPFTQADQSTTRRFGGTGLGLSICRELASMMGGEVGVISQPGAGSCFWCELPLPLAQAGALDALAAAAVQADLTGKRVLMVEDNAVNMLIGVALLEQWGVLVTQASDGQGALAAVALAQEQGRPFDAVLMDVQMPGMSGHEATRSLRRQHAAASLPVIALTAAALVSEREQALAAGMNDFLTKPVDAQRLRATLGRWIGQQVPAG